MTDTRDGHETASVEEDQSDRDDDDKDQEETIRSTHVEEEEEGPTPSRPNEDHRLEGEEEDPPRLTYRRLQHGALAALLAEDRISCVAVHTSHFVVGTQWGTVAHFALPDARPLCAWPQVHSAAVTSVALDETGEYLASSSDDGTVHLFVLPKAPASDPAKPEERTLATTAATGKPPVTWTHKRSLKATAIAPFYARASAKYCVAQAATPETLLVHENGWLGAKESKVAIPLTTSTIWAMDWQGASLAWCDEKALHVMDWSSKKVFWTMDRARAAPRPDLYRPRLFWDTSRAFLYCAWADQLDILHVRDQRARVYATMRVDFAFSGFAPLSMTTTTPTAASAKADQNDLIAALVFPMPSAPLPPVHDQQEKTEKMDVEEAVESVASPVVLSAPEIRLLDYNGADVATDILQTAKADGRPHFSFDYLLRSHLGPQDETRHLLILPQDVLTMSPTTRADQVRWCLAKHQYVRCLQLLEEVEDRDEKTVSRRLPWTTAGISRDAIQYYVERNEFASAASFLPHAVPSFGGGGEHTIGEQWAFYLDLFRRHKHVKAILPYFPRAPPPALDKVAYTSALIGLAEEDEDAFVLGVGQWTALHLYDPAAVLEGARPFLTSCLQPDQNASVEPAVAVAEACAQLYLEVAQPVAALALLLRTTSSRVTCIIEEHQLEKALLAENLLPAFLTYHRRLHAQEKIASRQRKQTDRSDAVSEEQLLENEIEEEEDDVFSAGVRYLASHLDRFPMEAVLQQLLIPAAALERDLFAYLCLLMEADGSLQEKATIDATLKKWVSDDRLIELCATYAPSRMLRILQRATEFDLEQACRRCRALHLVDAQIFLLNRMGNRAKALALILGGLRDIDTAIAYVREHAHDDKDDDLWQELVSQSIVHEDLIAPLFAKASAHVPLASLLQKLPKEATIEGFRDAILHVLQDLTLQISLREGCERILVNDSIGMMQRMDRALKAGHFVSRDNKRGLPSIAQKKLGEKIDR